MSIKRKIALAAVLLVAAAGLIAGLIIASRDYVSPEGTWNLTGGEAYDALMGIADMTFEFKPYKYLSVTVTTPDSAETIEGNWDVEIFDLHIKLEGETTVFDYEVSGDTLTITNEDGSTMIFTRAAE